MAQLKMHYQRTMLNGVREERFIAEGVTTKNDAALKRILPKIGDVVGKRKVVDVKVAEVALGKTFRREARRHTVAADPALNAFAGIPNRPMRQVTPDRRKPSVIVSIWYQDDAAVRKPKIWKGQVKLEEELK